MTPERILNAVAAFLRPKVVAEGGEFELSSTVARTLSLLGGGPGKFRVILQYQREAATGNRGGRALTMLVIVQQSIPNLAANPGDAISVNEDALLARCTQVMKWARSIRFLNQDIQQDWPQMMPGSNYWLNDPGFPTRQIAHEFIVTFGADGVTTEDVTA